MIRPPDHYCGTLPGHESRFLSHSRSLVVLAQSIATQRRSTQPGGTRYTNSFFSIHPAKISRSAPGAGPGWLRPVTLVNRMEEQDGELGKCQFGACPSPQYCLTDSVLITNISNSHFDLQRREQGSYLCHCGTR